MNLESSIKLFPLRFQVICYRLSLITGDCAAEEPQKRNWGRPVSCLATGWRSVFMGTYDTWSELLGKLSVTSGTYRAMYGTHRRIDGTTTMAWLTAIVQVLAPLDGSWRTAASS